MAVIAAPPQDVYEWWMSMVKNADTDLRCLYRNGNFAHLGEAESRVRFGIDFGDDWAVSTTLLLSLCFLTNIILLLKKGPHLARNEGVNYREVSHITRSAAFAAISDRQNR
jgi:hypothetical protein